MLGGSSVYHSSDSIPSLEVLDIGTDGKSNAGTLGTQYDRLARTPISVCVLPSDHGQ